MSVQSETNDVKYELLYWPSTAGRGEFIRLALEAAKAPYYDTSNAEKGGVGKVVGIMTSTDISGPEAPALHPPYLRIKNPQSGSGVPLLLSQTPNILSYLGVHEGLAPQDDRKYLVQQYTLTALDLTNELHDVHHPVGVALYYEDQKPESLRKAKEVRKDRIPKFFGYFNRALLYNAKQTEGSVDYLVGEKLTYADTTLWEVVDGISFAFPKRVEELKAGEFKELFAFYERLKGAELKEYLESGKRIAHGGGVFRHYPELDVDQE